MTEEKKGIIEIHFEMTSPTMDLYAISIYNNEEKNIYTYQDLGDSGINMYAEASPLFYTKKKRYSTKIDADSDEGFKLLSFLFPPFYAKIHTPDYNAIKTFLNKFYPTVGTDDTKWSYLCKIKISGLNTNDINHLTSLNNRIKLPQNTRQNLKPISFLNRLGLNEHEPKQIPYFNVDINMPENNENCVYNMFKKRKGCKKISNLFNRHGPVFVNEIIDATMSKKIKLKLFDITGRVFYDNKLPQNKTYRNFMGLAANGHLYELKPVYKKPLLNKKEVPENFLEFYKNTTSNITISINNILYDNSGCCSVFKMNNNSAIDSIFFNKRISNFSHNAEHDILIKSLSYIHPDIYNLSYEYDMIKAYLNIAYNIMNICDKYPVFTVFDVFNKYDQEIINENYYYTVSKSAFEKIQMYGFINNIMMGKTLNLLLYNKIIEHNDIETFKKYSYLSNWADIICRIEKLAKYTVLKKTADFKKMTNDEIEEYLNKTPMTKNEVFEIVKNDFSIINGLLGKRWITSYTSINGIDSDKIDIEIETLNYGRTENLFTRATAYYGDISLKNSIVSKKETYKNLNSVNIYNKIIDECNLFLLKVLFAAKKLNPNAKLLKIKTDCIGFDSEIKFPEEYKKYFKVVSLEYITLNTDMQLEKEMPSVYKWKFRRTYIDGIELKKQCINNLSIFDKNETYIGPPGTGKTSIIQKKEFDYSATTSNLCAANMHEDAQTLYRLFGLYEPEKILKNLKKLKNKTLWIDEFSMIKKYMWNYIYMVALLNKDNDKKMYITGDINQIKPIGEDKLDIKNEILLKIFGKITHLTVDYRNDADLIKKRDFVLNNDIPTLFNEFEEMDNDNLDYLDCDNNLSYFLNTKAFINSNIINHRKYIFEQKNYKYYVSNGVIISSRTNMLELKINKNDRWKVIETTEKGFKIQNINKNTIIEIKNKLMKMFEVAFCITVHSSQGLTLKGTICIHDVRNMICKDKSILYTAITRTNNMNDIKIYYNKKYNCSKLIKYEEIEEMNFNKFDEIFTE